MSFKVSKIINCAISAKKAWKEDKELQAAYLQINAFKIRSYITYYYIYKNAAKL